MVWRGDRHVNAELDEVDVERGDPHVGDEYDEDAGTRGIFAAGWLRALLVLATFAAVAVVALPYVLDWLESTSSTVTAPVPGEQGARSLFKPASVPTPQATRSHPEPALRPRAAPFEPAQEKPEATATPTLPPRSEPDARASASRLLQMAKAPGGAQTREPAAAPRRHDGAPSGRSGSHWVQLGLFKDLETAERFAKSVREHGFPVQVVSVTRSPDDATPGGTYHLVRAGAFSDQALAAAARDDLRTRGYAGFLTEGTPR
jgi:cell division septation protein DedD